MSEVTTIKSGIKSRISSVLGSSYKELAFTLDLEKNSYKGNEKRYGVLAGTIGEQDEGVVGKITVIQGFLIRLTDGYASSQINDEDRIAISDGLMNSALTIYKDLINTQAGTPSLVTQVVNEMVTESVGPLGSKNIVGIDMNISIMYRKLL